MAQSGIDWFNTYAQGIGIYAKSAFAQGIVQSARIAQLITGFRGSRAERMTSQTCK